MACDTNIPLSETGCMCTNNLKREKLKFESHVYG